MSKKRRIMGKGHSKRNFKKNTGVHKINHVSRPMMRGGIRL